MKVLIACEYSGTVRDAFKALGHYALSCDLLPTEKPGNHYQGNVLDVINNGWDLMIAHPPCTHLAVSGARHFAAKKASGVQDEALDFVRTLLTPTDIVSGREARIHKMGPSPDRWKERSRTFPGIANAMANQWSTYIENL
jgi:hypothetical protein